MKALIVTLLPLFIRFFFGCCFDSFAAAAERSAPFGPLLSLATI